MASNRIAASGRALNTGRMQNSGRMQLPWRQNFFLRSDEMDNASWTKANLSITANAVPNFLPGATDADNLVETAATALHSVSQTPALLGIVSNRAIVTITAYVAAGTRQWFGIRNSVAAWTMFDIVNGLVGNSFVVGASLPIASGIFPVFGHPTVWKCWTTSLAGSALAANSFAMLYAPSAVNATSAATVNYTGVLGNVACTVYGAQYTVGYGPPNDYIHTAGAIVNDGTSRNFAFIA